MDFMNSSLPELSHVNDDVDLDQLDFEVLPWLKNINEINNNKILDRHQTCELCDLKFLCEKAFKQHQETHLHFEKRSLFGLPTLPKSLHHKKQLQCNVCLKNPLAKHTCAWLGNAPKPNPFTNSMMTTTLVLTKEVITSTPMNANSKGFDKNEDPDRDKNSNLSKKQSYGVMNFPTNLRFFQLIERPT